MKAATLAFLLLLLGGLARASDQKSSFLIKTESVGLPPGQESDLKLFLEADVIESLEKEFPCAQATTESDISNQLSLQRQRSLLGGGGEENLKALADSFGLNDYLILLKITPLGERTALYGMCLNLKTSKTVSVNASLTGAGGKAAIAGSKDFAKRFVRKMAYLEICPYKGPVHVTVQSKRNKEEKEEYPVYCNQSDQMYKKNTKITKTTDTDWSLQKTGRRSASGTVTHQNYECAEVVEENGCYRCPSGRQGGRTFTQKSTATTAIDGLSEESRREGKAQKDARIRLEFNEDDTFTVYIEATSRDGTRHERVEEKAEGTCDTKTAPPKVTDGKINVPLPGRWGPFAGSPVDKVLRGNTNEKKTDPLTEEETTTGIEFELQRN